MKAKPIIIVVGTLIIGFVLGMLTSAQLRYHRLKPVSVFFSEDRFRKGFYDLIKPDEKQKEVIDQILRKYAKVNSETQVDFRKKMDSSFKEYWKELEPNLNKDQIARLKEMEKRISGMSRGSSRNSPKSNTFRGNERTPPKPGDRPEFGRDSDRMRNYHDSGRMWNYNDSNRMRSSRMRPNGDSTGLKSNK